MSERALRGTRLGATSYETDSGIDLAPRQDVRYSCPNGHRFDMPFALEAEVPPAWECRVCGAQALRVDGVAPEEKPGKPTRTHWDMLLERRTVADLEEVLAERLEVLRGGGIAYAALAGITAESALVDASTGVPTAARSAGPGRTGTATAKPPAKKAAPTKKSTAAKAAPATKSTGKPPAKKSPTAKSAAK